MLVAIVNFRTPEVTIDCLASVAPEVPTVPGMRVVVVENGSGDDSEAKLRRALEERGWSWAELLVSPKNLGFSGGNNLAIAHAEPAEFVLLLNSDTLVSPGCFRHCLDVMAAHPDAGAMSCRVLNRDRTIQNVTRRFPTPARVTAAALGLPWNAPRLFRWADTEDPGWDREHTAREVDWLGGAFLFIRSSALDGRVRLDEDFFFYGEDVVFNHVLKRRGWKRRYDPKVAIVHLGGASSDPGRLPSGQRSVLHWKARYLVQEKCWGTAAALWLYGLDASFTALRYGLAKVRGRADTPRGQELRAQLEMIRKARGRS